jgi:hemerythrin
MSVGVKLLDNDHKRLVLLINQLHDGLVSGRAKPEIESIFEELVIFARVHHAQEEQLLSETGYPSLEAHRHEHDQMTGKLIELQMRFANTTQLAIELEILQGLREWLFRHIKGSDHGFISHLRESDVNVILATRKTLDGLGRDIRQII